MFRSFILFSTLKSSTQSFSREELCCLVLFSFIVNRISVFIAQSCPVLIFCLSNVFSDGTNIFSSVLLVCWKLNGAVLRLGTLSWTATIIFFIGSAFKFDNFINTWTGVHLSSLVLMKKGWRKQLWMFDTEINNFVLTFKVSTHLNILEGLYKLLPPFLLEKKKNFERFLYYALDSSYRICRYIQTLLSSQSSCTQVAQTARKTLDWITIL